MKETTTMGIKELRARFGDRIAAAQYCQEPTIVTKNGTARAALVPYAWYEELLRLRAEAAATTGA